MEEHEIISRLKNGQFSDEARPVAEAILRGRGIDPSNPVIPEDQRERPIPPRPWKPRLLPILFATFAGGLAGRQIGAVFAGAIGAGFMAALLAYIGWLIGARVAWQVRKLHGKPARFVAATAAGLAWIVAMGLVGILAEIGTGGIRP
ncbi:MAG: hypothetical protein IPG77_19695 [Betaproteobacteria bacterium]|jgi:hypothetical protein|nr:hypothetical protein [Betaproteobacteria bacterium]